jgi:tetratricopeptide (TPR) repeat protein
MLSRLLFACIVLCFSISTLAEQDLTEPRLAARDELNQGVRAFRGANYEEALEHFNKAVQLDPELKVARLYLATAYAQQYVPGVETPENLDLANHALEQYAAVLQRDPANVTSIKGIGYLQLQLKHFPEAKEGYKKAVDLDPMDPENFYSVGVLDWSMVYRDVMQEKSKLKLDSEDTLSRSTECGDLRAKELANIEDGIAMLKQAITLRPNYDDAIAYLNLLYRLRADLDCGNETAYKADLKNADQWADSAMAARKTKADAAAAAKSRQDSVTADPR